MQVWLVRVVAAVFLGYGAGFVFVPEPLLKAVVGEVPVAASAWIDMRATYGGLSLGVGALLWVLSVNHQTLRSGVLGVVLLMAGMASGRAVGMVVDGTPNGYMVIYLVLEVLTAMLGLWAWRSLPRDVGRD